MNTTTNKPPNTHRTEHGTDAEPASASASEDQSGRTSNKPLRSGDVFPAIRSAPPARDAFDEAQFYRTMPYERYLTTGHWRTTRNAALKRAGYRCAKCTAGRNLQVHHLSYDRLGAETDSDLEVLCRGCHLGLHVHEVKNGLGVYLKLVSETLAAESFHSMADLLEAVKVRCARAKIPYYDGQIHAALALLDRDKRLNFAAPMPEKYRELLHEGREGAPFTHAEACGLIAKLGAQVALKPMPTVRRITQHKADKRIALRQIAALLVDQVRACEEAEAAVDSEPKR